MDILEHNLTSIYNKTKYGLLAQTARKDRDASKLSWDIGRDIMKLTKKVIESLQRIRTLDQEKNRLVCRRNIHAN